MSCSWILFQTQARVDRALNVQKSLSDNRIKEIQAYIKGLRTGRTYNSGRKDLSLDKKNDVKNNLNKYLSIHLLN